MKIRIVHHSYVIDFLDIDFNSKEISNFLETEINNLLTKYKFKGLEDWNIQFNVIYGNNESIRIFKTLSSYKKEKEKLITIHIPIPLKIQISWGVEEKQLISLRRHPNEDKSVIMLKIDFMQYESRQVYILECLRRSILKTFEDGFTVNGIKVKSPP